MVSHIHRHAASIPIFHGAIPSSAALSALRPRRWASPRVLNITEYPSKQSWAASVILCAWWSGWMVDAHTTDDDNKFDNYLWPHAVCVVCTHQSHHEGNQSLHVQQHTWQSSGKSVVFYLSLPRIFQRPCKCRYRLVCRSCATIVMHDS